MLEAPIGCCRRRGTERGGGCNLTSSHPVDHVVAHYHQDVGVAPCGVDEVAKADSYDVAVAAEDHNVEVRAHELDARRHGNAPAMKRMNRVSQEVRRWNPRTAPNSAREAEPAEVLVSQLMHRPEERVTKGEQPTTRAEGGLEPSHVLL